MNLYEVNQELENCFDPETGELLEEQMNELQIEKDAIVENVALSIKNDEAMITALKNEESELKKRRESYERKVASKKKYLSSNIDNDSKFETPKVRIKFNKSTTCEVDEKIVPKRWFIKTLKLDKAGIKKALQDGKKVKGAMLVEHKNINIK